MVSPLLQSLPSVEGNVLDHWLVFFGQTSWFYLHDDLQKVDAKDECCSNALLYGLSI